MSQPIAPVAPPATARTVNSVDGTAIAVEHVGQGPALVLVDGALCHRAMGPMAEIAMHLASRFTVYRYDRRGRGESGGTAPFAIERELEDLEAVIRAAGGSAHLFGVSSGAVLALEAANRGLPVRKLGLFEAPFIVDGTRAPMTDDFLPRVEAHLAEGRPGEAVKMFLTFVGMPGFMCFVMSLTPMWRKLQAMAPTLPADLKLVIPFQQGRPLPQDRWQTVAVPTLVMDGGKSPAWMRNGARALADAIPGATYQSLPGQTHMVKAAVLAPALTAFLEA
ncbi:putative hydrolase [compost metagenome]